MGHLILVAVKSFAKLLLMSVMQDLPLVGGEIWSHRFCVGSSLTYEVILLIPDLQPLLGQQTEILLPHQQLVHGNNVLQLNYRGLYTESIQQRSMMEYAETLAKRELASS